MPAHKFTKKDLKRQDSFVSTTERFLEFGQRNATAIGVVLLVLVVVLVGGSYLRSSRADAAREASAMLYQGQTFLTEGNYAAAGSVLQDCIDSHGDTEFGRYARVAQVQAFLAAGDSDRALAQVQRYRDEIPADHAAATDLGLLEAYAVAAVGQPGEAADLIEEYISPGLTDAVYYERSVQRADWLSDAGRNTEAVAVLAELDRMARSGERTSFPANDLEKRLAVARAFQG